MVIRPFIYCCLSAIVIIKGTAAHELCQQARSDFKWRRYPNTCDSLYFCFLGRAVTLSCPPGQVAGANMRHCVPENSLLDDCSAANVHKGGRIFNVAATCKPGERFPSEKSCAKFSECVTFGSSNGSILEKECSYPELYDISTQKCSHYGNVKCEPGVFEPKSPCDYAVNQCGTGPHSGSCIPCNIRFPTCTGLPDGMNPWHGKEWSPYYVVCQQERISYHGLCKSEKESQVFHPDKRQCVNIDIKTIIG